ncbi:MAG: tail fiber domain-containing protein, partial [Waddliaceae bacterium]
IDQNNSASLLGFFELFNGTGTNIWSVDETGFMRSRRGARFGSNIVVGSGTTGCVMDANSTVIAGICSSDMRLKKDVQPFHNILGSLTMLQPVHFKWKADEYPEFAFGTSTSFGLVAQNVEKVLPELVTEDDKGFKAVKYNKLPLLMLQAIKELKAENDLLKKRLETLERTSGIIEQVRAN